VETARAYDAETRKARAERILDTAAELLQRWGYSRLTMDDIAARAGIGKGTIYLHWKTREALFEAVLQRELQVLVAKLLAAIRADPYNALPHRLGRLYYVTIMQRPLMRAFFTADLEVLGKLAKYQRERATELDTLRSDFVRLLAEHGLVRSDVPADEVAYGFRAVIVGFFLADPFFEGEQPSLERKADVLELILKDGFQLSHEPSRETLEVVAAHVVRLLSQADEVDWSSGILRRARG
jgi:AcrR family transcriptional regulator